MRVVTVRDLDDPRVARFRHVRDADLLATQGLFIAEGRVVVERVLADRRHRVEQLLLAPGPWSQLQPVVEAHAPDAEVLLLPSPADFEPITGFNLHRGCLALVRRPVATSWRTALGDHALCIVLERVADADNVGSVFRNAAAFGAAAVLLSPDTCDPLYRKAIRTSMAASTRLPFARMEPWPEAMVEMRDLGVTIVALSPRQPSVTLDEFVERPRPPRMALLVGSEGAGISAEAERLAGVRVRIPVLADVDSVNLAVATGIALSRLTHIRG